MGAPWDPHCADWGLCATPAPLAFPKGPAVLLGGGWGLSPGSDLGVVTAVAAGDAVAEDGDS